jgi:hypothetical protein
MFDQKVQFVEQLRRPVMVLDLVISDLYTMTTVFGWETKKEVQIKIKG